MSTHRKRAGKTYEGRKCIFEQSHGRTRLSQNGMCIDCYNATPVSPLALKRRAAAARREKAAAVFKRRTAAQMHNSLLPALLLYGAD